MDGALNCDKKQLNHRCGDSFPLLRRLPPREVRAHCPIDPQLTAVLSM
ncbi:hypothetical protein SynTAK9802_02235 [Synechococcus sp. TAK9802]|nr:hypothetical protein SynTAK9802_02235 [Synechococcus sp. TAK9802]